ncbi:MAG TPA: iron-sulfur cluster assembly scaffold protein, partial [Candidatus Thermoplasmatota archaeon]|nr:iron-sulfur cluster assembly scaffold protein [Candidatus Thermoplasmatota archaeon]
MSGEEMYREHVLEHYRNPRNFGVLEPADADGTETNPLCGDEVRITMKVRRGVVEDVRFSGRGCAISLAS